MAKGSIDSARAESGDSRPLHGALVSNLTGFAYCKMHYKDGVPEDFEYLRVNRDFELLSGLRDVVGKRITELAPGIREADPSLFEIYGRVAMTGEPEKFEIYVEALKSWFSVSASSPEQGYFVAVFDVIDERKRIERALRESEARYRLLFENMAEGFSLNEIITDENGHPVDFRFLETNAAYEKHTGLKYQEIIGKTVREILPQVDPKQIEEYGRVALTGVPTVFEYLSKTFNRYYRVNVFCPQIGRFATTFEDITERMNFEKALSLSEEKYRTVFETGTDAIFIIDRNTMEILDVNQAASLIYGYSREQLLTMKNTDLSCEPEETVAAAKDLQKRIHLRYHRKHDGTIFAVDIAANFLDFGGRPVSWPRSAIFRAGWRQSRKSRARVSS